MLACNITSYFRAIIVINILTTICKWMLGTGPQDCLIFRGFYSVSQCSARFVNNVIQLISRFYVILAIDVFHYYFTS